MIAFDTETEPIGPGCAVPRLVCLTWQDDGKEPQIVRWDEAHAVAVDLLGSAGPIVGANTPYDMAQICQACPDLIPAVWQAYADDRVTDVETRQKLIDIAHGQYRVIRHAKGKKTDEITGGPYSLQRLYYRATGLVLPKDEWRLRYGELRDTPLPQWPVGAVQYAKDDAEATAIVWAWQEKSRKVHGHDALVDEFRQARARWVLFLTSAWGLRTSGEGWSKFGAGVKMRIAELEGVVRKAGVLRPNGTKDTKAAKARMVTACAALGAKPKMTATGQICLDKEVCAESGDPALEAYAEIASLLRVRDTDIPKLSVPIVQTRYEELLETGRTGSSSPPIQNIRRLPGLRECFVARPGTVFVVCDYAMIELRTFAQICIWVTGASVMADLINAGRDLHRHFGGVVIDKSYDWCTENAATPEVEKARQGAKPVNFGIPGGMGPVGLKRSARTNYGVDFTLQEAAGLKALWLRTFPEAVEYFERIRGDHCWGFDKRTGMDLTAIKHFRSDRLRGGVCFTASCNSFFQGLAADLFKAAMFQVSRECYDPTMRAAGQRSPLLGSRIAHEIHDELIVESPEDIAAECAERVRDIMCTESQNWIPDVPAKAEPALSRIWSKKAKAVYDAAGRLVVWSG